MIKIIDSQEFKQYKNTKYFCSKSGEVYSSHLNKILKKLIRQPKGSLPYYYVDVFENGVPTHVNIHKMVFETWNRPLIDSEVLRHKDNNSLNNNIENILVGSQKDNIHDCINANRRVGNIMFLKIRIKATNEELVFLPAKDFIEFSGHTQTNGSLTRIFTRDWFNKDYEVLEYYNCPNLDFKEGVETNHDECNGVG